MDTKLHTGECQLWPALVLPSGTILAIASDDEGNGPGAIIEFKPSHE